jgi:AcrR family transcriptional regulator
LAEQGYEDLSTNRVALAAGVSIGSLYQYFPSKEALVGELVDRHCDRMNALFADAFLRGAAAEPRELARLVVGAIYQATIENPRLVRTLREKMPHLGRVNRLEENLEQVTRAVAAYFADRKKLLRVRSPELAAFYVVEIGESLTMATMTKRPQVDPDVVIDEITDIIVRYVFK